MKSILLLIFIYTSGITLMTKSIISKDIELSKNILGLWTRKITYPNLTLHAEILYKKDGTSESYGEVCDHGKCEKVTYLTKWSIKNGFITWVTQPGSSKDFPIDEVVKDKILYINDKEMSTLGKSGLESKSYKTINPAFFKK